ncbi:MAG TPA: ComEC family competence protein, partial [Thermohalobaculum sp.]|nr:ComEC family competence protein [Thermohalobaculum sp.]
GSVRPVPVGMAAILPLMTLGGLWLFLWRGRWRLAGVVGIVGALALWATGPPRPEVLIAPEGRLIGVLGPEGRVLDHDRAQSFAAKTWLRRDGDGASQKQAAARPGMTRGKGWSSTVLSNGWRLEVLHWRRIPPGRIWTLCKPRTLVVMRFGPEYGGPCIYLGKADLARLGAVAVHVAGDELRLVPAREPAERRLWSRDGGLLADVK